MKTLLLFPPASDPSHPPLGIASLAAYLGGHGEEVAQIDLNVLAYSELLSSENLRRCGHGIQRRIDALESQPELELEEAAEYRLLVENSLAAERLEELVPRALEALRDPATYASRRLYAEAAGRVRRGMELVSAAHYPLRWYARGYSMSYLPTRSADVLAAVDDRRQNLFVRFFETQLDRIAAEQPDLVGISLNYYCQLIPAMTLAALIKQHLVDPMVVVGGGLVCFFEDRWEALASFRHLVDAWVPFEGEVPLLDLVRAAGSGDGLSTVPGLLHFDGSRPLFTEPRPPLAAERLPAPCFDGLELPAYLAPSTVLPVLTSRGCYWGRCAFCSHHQLYRGRFRMRPVEQVVEQMSCLAERHGCRHFYFTDECIPPRTASRLATALRESERSYEWFTEMRFERGLDLPTAENLVAGGCLMLMLGLESGVQRVLDLMEKGMTPERAEQILESCHRVGIRTFVMFFAGFPTETAAEAERTASFVESLGPLVTHVAFTNFILEQRAPVHRDPQRYGIAEILPYEDEDLKIYSAYRTTTGLSADEAVGFLDDIKERPGIAALIDLYLLSRSHLAFLPPRDDARLAAQREPEALPADPQTVQPVRSPDLVASTLPFNLEEIRRRLERRGQVGEVAVTQKAVSRSVISQEGAGDSGATWIPRCPTNYVYSAEREELLEVGADGLELLKACSGRFTLGEILSAVGDGNRETTLRYLGDMANRGFVHWESRV